MMEPSYLGDTRRPLGLLLLGLAIGGIACGVIFLWLRSTTPRVQIRGEVPRVITRSTPMEIEWESAHGVREVRVTVEQDGVTTPVFQDRQEPNRLLFWRAPATRRQAAFSIDKQSLPGLKPGKAILAVQAQANDFRGQWTGFSKELPVVLESPRVTADTEPVFFRRGGTGIVTFTAGGGWSEAGVRVGPYHFPSYPLKGRADRRVSLFAFPPTVDAGTEPVIYARNQAGEEAESSFPHRMTNTKFRERILDLGDGFLRKVFGELDPAGEGTATERFLRVNASMRRANDAALARLAVKTEPRPLWKGTFQLLPRGKAEALYGDHRTYKIAGKPLNAEWHLGVDMASIKRAEVPAVNDGRVVFAGTMGIYGNVVVVDHGMSVQSVYAHLSEALVKETEAVKRGQTIGRSGMTGLAGGDHLHLGLMVAGVFVDPVEWSYAHWIEKTIDPIVQ